MTPAIRRGGAPDARAAADLYLRAREAALRAGSIPAGVHDDETTELRLSVDPYRRVNGVVVAPTGLPASGATVRVSTDGGLTWTDSPADLEGKFEYVAPSGVAEIQMLFVTYAHPVAMLRVPITDGANPPMTVMLRPSGGRIRVAGNRAYVIRGNTLAPMRMFDLPHELAVTRDGAYVEPGSYAICPDAVINKSCREVLVAPGTDTLVNLQPTKGTE